MTGKRKALLAVIISLAVILAVVAGVLGWITYDSNSYDRHIARAEKYVQLGDLTNAAIEYQAAINIRPNNTDIYLALADVYIQDGRFTMAQRVLESGYEATGSDRITSLLLDLSGSGTQSGINTLPDRIFGDGSNTGINFTLLYLIGGNDYNTLRLDHGVEKNESTVDGGCLIRVAGVAANLFYNHKDVDSTGVKPVSDSYPMYAVADSIRDIFNGASYLNMSTLEDFGAENVGLIDDPDHGKVVTFVAGDCLVNIASDENGTISDGAWHEIIPLSSAGLGDDDEGSVFCKGMIKSTTTGSGVSRAELRFRKGTLTVGNIEATTTTDGFGDYNVKLDPGDYTVEVQCVGYTTEFFPVMVSFNDEVKIDDIFISPMLGQGQIRIVLEWGSAPSDLDSHLEGTSSSGAGIRVDYTNKSESRGGQKIAELDLDDTSAFGPETTTIYDGGGTYHFYVIDFTGSGTMSNSGAVVKIYTEGSSTPIEVHVCPGLGNYWDVCTITNGQVTVTNHG